MKRRALLAGLAGAACGAEQAPPGRSILPLWFTYGGKNRETLERLVRGFNAAQSEVWVKAVYQGDYYEGLAKLRTAISARSAPALSHVVGEVVPYLYEAGVLEPLGGYPGAGDLDLTPELGQAGSWQGGSERALSALPFNRSTPIVFVNARLFDEAGLAPPSTWDELIAVAQRLTLREGKRVARYGFGCPVDWWFWAALVLQAGGEVMTPEGEVTLGGAAGERALGLWQRLVHDDGVMKPPPGRDYAAWDATLQDFLAGQAAMIWASTAHVKYLEETAKFPVRAAPLPRDVRLGVPTGGTHWIVLRSAPAEQKRAAWTFLSYLLGAERAADWARSTGYIPVTRGAVGVLEAAGHYRAHPNDRVALDQLSVARAWPWSTQLFRVQREIVQPRLEAAVLGRRAASVVLNEARAAARDAR